MIVCKPGTVAIPGAAGAAKNGDYLSIWVTLITNRSRRQCRRYGAFSAGSIFGFLIGPLGDPFVNFIHSCAASLFLVGFLRLCFFFLFRVVNSQICFKLLFGCYVKNQVVWPSVQLRCPSYSQAVDNWAFGEEILLRGASSCGRVFCRLW